MARYHYMLSTTLSVIAYIDTFSHCAYFETERKCLAAHTVLPLLTACIFTVHHQ